MGRKKAPAAAVRAREVEVARLSARRLPQTLIAQTLAISERQVRYDLQHFRERIEEAAGANKAIAEVYEELFRVGWQDHDKASEGDPKAPRAAFLRVLLNIADRMAALSGIDLKNRLPGAEGDTYVLGEATFDQRRLEVSDELAHKIAAARDGEGAGGR